MKTILITGATSGIGEALCHQYIAQGEQVIACGRNQAQLSILAERAFQTLAFDVTDAKQVATVAQQISHIDLLVLNAGNCRYIDNAKQFNGELFADIINTNLLSLGYLLQHLLPKVVNGGQLAFISSSATLLPFTRAEAYGASKAGVDYLAKSLALDLAADNIDVTLVHPGFVKTPLTDKNDFSMPFLLTSEQAAMRIINGLSARKPYLHFPKRLTLLLKLIALLPSTIWRTLILKGAKA